MGVIGNNISSVYNFKGFWNSFIGNEISYSEELVFNSYEKLRKYVEIGNDIKKLEEKIGNAANEIKDLEEKIESNTKLYNENITRQEELIEMQGKSDITQEEIQKIKDEITKVMDSQLNVISENNDLTPKLNSMIVNLNESKESLSRLGDAFKKSKENLDNQRNEKEEFENKFPELAKKIQSFKECDISEAEKIVKEAFMKYASTLLDHEIYHIDEKDFSIFAKNIQEFMNFEDRCYNAIQDSNKKDFDEVAQEQKKYNEAYELLDSAYSNISGIYFLDGYSKKYCSLNRDDYKKDNEYINKSYEYMNKILDGNIDKSEQEKFTKELWDIQEKIPNDYDTGAVARITGNASRREMVQRSRFNLYTDLANQIGSIEPVEKSKDVMGLSNLVFEDKEVSKNQQNRENNEQNKEEKQKSGQLEVIE